MLDKIWKVIGEEISGERAGEYIRRIYSHARYLSFDKIWQTAQEIAEIMREIGLKDVEILGYPADGVTNYGGWIMPIAWDMEEARLEIAEPTVDEPLLASYEITPHSLMMFSAPTDPEGVIADVLLIEEDIGTVNEDIEGKIVFSNFIGPEFASIAFEKGAVGIISDYLGLMGSRYSKGDDYLKNAVQLHNYTIPPWRIEKRGFGFSLSPSQGKRLRALIEKEGKVRLKAVVKTRLYEGKIPMVTGLLPGEEKEEIVITSHLCEPGANDNASGCGLGLEIARSIKEAVEKGKLAPLKRGIRLLYGWEVRSQQAFIANYPHLNRFLAGINLDMVGSDLNEARSVCNLVHNFPPLYSYTDFLALLLLRNLQRENPLFRFAIQRFVIDDNLLGEPGISAPFCLLGCWPDAHYHTSLDTPENISPSFLKDMGKVAGTYCYFLANADFPEALRLAHMVKDLAKEEIIKAIFQAKSRERSPEEISEWVEFLVMKNKTRLKSLQRLVRSRGFVPTEEELKRNKDWFAPNSYLFKDEELKRCIGRLCDELETFGRKELAELKNENRYLLKMKIKEKQPPLNSVKMVSSQEENLARELVPLRTFRGALSFEFLDEIGRDRLEKLTGLKVGWGVPAWLQLAVFLCDGKKTVLEIHQFLKKEAPVELPILINSLQFLAHYDFIRWRPVIRKEDFKRAFENLGLSKGSIVMVHSSLSRFGYVEGGEDTVIDALLETIGEEGTLLMPTFTFSWLGNPPYDPKKTPSRVGAITEAFRKREGVIRSLHPTHSVASFGPLSDKIVGEHNWELPVFDKRGAFGKLYELNAHILMLSPLNTNTMMHMAEELVGLPLPDFVGHIIIDGRRKIVPIRRAPWHVNFAPYYEVLFQRGLVNSTKLGESEIYLMRAKDVVDISTEVLRKNPLMVTIPTCDCAFCRRIRTALGAIRE
ncbi:DUF4910 domain-containing protein [bacterium]|nr:DUF4910 domain-containing protein [bacterium]